jgi:hypothetical protein
VSGSFKYLEKRLKDQDGSILTKKFQRDIQNKVQTSKWAKVIRICTKFEAVGALDEEVEEAIEYQGPKESDDDA